ncbi:hypothetical protein SANTM175S_10798 [Streptomyces antimycoticus]
MIQDGTAATATTAPATTPISPTAVDHVRPGRLIRAYGGAVGEALDRLGTVTRQRFRLVTVTVDHQRAGKLENDLRATGRAVREVRYAEAVTIELGLPEADVDAFRDWLADATAGTAAVEVGGEAYQDT